MSLISRRDFIKTGSTGAAGIWAASGMFHQLYANTVAKAESGLRFRQIHLDFHTSEHITGIGESFDPEEFASTLKRASVNSVTCFARCHHGYIYHDTKKFPERRHPHLRKNLLKEQIEVCHKNDIKVPIYTTIQWDYFTGRQHPEWLVLDDQGKPIGTPVYEPGFYRFLCINSPYRQFLKEHIKEIFESVPVDGLFLDIVKVQECSCNFCQKAMVDRKLEPSKAEDRKKFAAESMKGFKNEITNWIKSFSKDAKIFYNGGHIEPGIRETIGTYSHLELESLPSGGWGYLHFPLTSRYARTLGKDIMGMTGKFHTSWGDFHSLKNKPALDFECFTMLALGAKCSVGDQLHPNGEIDQSTYELIGSVYREVEKKEPWCIDATPLVDIGVFSPEEFIGGRLPEPSMGVVRMLQEGCHQFDIIDTKSDLTKYKVLILPDVITVNKDLNARLEAYLKRGGAILASHQSGVNPEQNAFGLESLGLELVGSAPFSPDFILPSGKIGEGLPKTELVMYLQGNEVKPKPGTKILAEVTTPYFNRNYQHFSSHKHTPSSGKRGYPAVVQNGNVIYFSHPVFTQYNKNAPRWVKQIFMNALNILLPDPVIKVVGPSSILSAFNDQSVKKRSIVHLLHYIPEHRGKDFDTIEDVIPVYDVKVSLKPLRPVQKVKLVPLGTELKFTENNNRLDFTVPEINGHLMIEIS